MQKRQKRQSKKTKQFKKKKCKLGLNMDKNLLRRTSIKRTRPCCQEASQR